MNNWFIFAKERFHLSSHLTLILLFVGTHVATAKMYQIESSVPVMGLIFLAMLVFFFKMRLYDEIKDYDLDVKINPNRPLPRGLVTLGGVKKGIVICIVLEIALYAMIGINPLLVLLIAIAYSLLMYKEFFIGTFIRPHLTTYALMHTVVTVPMGLSMFSALSGKMPGDIPSPLILFALCNWPLFNIFEFGRKTFATKEERGQVESYSKIFGRHGAVILVITMAIFSLIILNQMYGKIGILQLGTLFLLVALGFYYSIKNTVKAGKMYRAFSSFYIVLFYVFYLLEILFLKDYPKLFL